jgi:hypothetical protein
LNAANGKENTMTRERRTLLTFNLALIGAMIPCLFFSLRHGQHHFLFTQIFYALLLLNSLLQYRFQIKRTAPDTMIHLFPKSQDERL